MKFCENIFSAERIFILNWLSLMANLNLVLLIVVEIWSWSCCDKHTYWTVITKQVSNQMIGISKFGEKFQMQWWYWKPPSRFYLKQIFLQVFNQF